MSVEASQIQLSTSTRRWNRESGNSDDPIFISYFQNESIMIMMMRNYLETVKVTLTLAPPLRVKDSAGTESGLATTATARRETMARNCILNGERGC